MSYMGGLVVRVMRSAPASVQKLAPTDPRCKPYMSVHGTGRAVDVGSNDPKILASVFEYLVNNADELFIEEVHQYNFKAPGASKAWGRGFRCSRANKDRGIVNWDAKNNGGTPGGMWLHYEVSADADAKALEAYFRANK
jgi:hypothetical protein